MGVKRKKNGPSQAGDQPLRFPTRIENGFVVVDVPAGSPPITSEQVKELESELDERYLWAGDRPGEKGRRQG